MLKVLASVGYAGEYTMTPIPPRRVPSLYSPDEIRDISEAVYKIRLEEGNMPKGAVERMLADDNDDGKKLRQRAAAYDPLTRAYLKVLTGRLTEKEWERMK